jgi:KDO2-lipid IV(A) lauroyltransferase
MSRILYYLILLPLSRLPLSALYKLSDFLYLVLYRGLGYRKKVVYGNLQNSFPEKTAAEIKAIADEFYHFLFDLMVETIRLFSMPESELVEH